MSTYIVSYDLREGHEYEALYEGIKSYGTWAHILESVWAVVTDQTATQVRDYLRVRMDNDGGLFVVKSGHGAAWQNVLCKNEWLIDRL